jgi:2-keto-4-pentenoate hydratase
MEDIAAGRAAAKLLAEHKANLRFRPLGPPDAPATIADAYDIQDKYVALLRREHGDDVGYKVGLTSATMQAFCGIDHPIAGVVLARRVYRSGASIRRSDFGRLGLEFEIAVRVKSDVQVTGVPYTAEMIRPHIDGVGAAIELVDDRSADYANLDVLSLVADNSWNAGIVLSEFATTWPDLERVPGARNEGPRCDRRRPRTRHPRPSLQFGRVARHAAGLNRRGAESRSGRDDRKRHENRIPRS